MLGRIKELIAQAENEYYETGECGRSSIELSNISKEALTEIANIMTEFGCDYWLCDEPAANPERKYRLWVSVDRYELLHYTWGLSRAEL